jgi:ParB/RepB/Spo0J family partition protein
MCEETRDIALDSIYVGPRRRPVDSNAVRDIAQSIERQGLLQPIGVKPADDDTSACAWVLVFGAHRLGAHVLLQRETIEARILEAGLSEEEYLLIELQENSARNDLTKGQRKAYAAEMGRLLSKLAKDSHSLSETQNWFVDFIQKANVPRPTFYNWWNAFCEATGRTVKPRDATDHEREAFFAWLQAQREKEAAEKARKEAEARAEERRQDFAATLENLQILERDYGHQEVMRHVIVPFLGEEYADVFAD